MPTSLFQNVPSNIFANVSLHLMGDDEKPVRRVYPTFRNANGDVLLEILKATPSPLCIRLQANYSPLGMHIMGSQQAEYVLPVSPHMARHIAIERSIEMRVNHARQELVTVLVPLHNSGRFNIADVYEEANDAMPQRHMRVTDAIDAFFGTILRNYHVLSINCARNAVPCVFTRATSAR